MRTTTLHVWTTQDVASYLEINKHTVIQWLKKGYLPRPTRIGTSYRWNATLIEKRIPKEWIKLGLNQLRLNLELRVREQFKTSAERRSDTKHIHNLTDDLHVLAKQKEKLTKTIAEAQKTDQTLGQITKRDLFGAHALSGLLASGIYEREITKNLRLGTKQEAHLMFQAEYFSLIGTLVREYADFMIGAMDDTI